MSKIKQNCILVNTVRVLHNIQAINDQLESIGLSCESSKSENTIGHKLYGSLDILVKTFCFAADIPTECPGNETSIEEFTNKLLDFASKDNLSITDIIKFAADAREKLAPAHAKQNSKKSYRKPLSSKTEKSS